MKILRRLYRYVRPYRAWAALALTSMLIVAASYGAIVSLLQPLFDETLSGPRQERAEKAPDRKAQAIDVLLRRDRPEGQRGWVIDSLDRATRPAREWWNENEKTRWRFIPLILLGVFVVRAIASFFSEYAFEKVGLSTVRDLRNALYASIIGQSNRFFSVRPTGELVSRIVSDADAIQVAVSIRMGDLFQESVNVIVLATFVFLTNTELALVAFVVAPIIVYPIVHFGKRLRKTTRQSQERMADIATLLEETIRGIRIVKAFAMEKFEITRFNEATRKHLKVNLKARKTQAMSSPIMELLAGTCMAMLFAYASLRIHAGALTLGQFLQFMASLALMYAPIKRLNKVNLAMNTALSAAERVFAVLDVENDVRERENAASLTDVRQGVRYEDVRFSYGAGYVLDGIRFDVRPGEMVAIVGGSGSGKSTLVNLLPRFYDVSEGSVTIDGVDVRDLSLTSLRSLIGMVTQEVILFNDTVRNNIAYGRDDIPLSAIEDAARAANAADFIDALPNRYDAQIGESGVLLSGGQRQRLAIARALLKNPPILILDEATSALDTESERLVQSALVNLMKGRTTLVIAHRLSTVRSADKIIVLEHGSIAESGRHEELYRKNGIYRRLHDLQFIEQEAKVTA
jgi:ATP-binding cassette, subfamily B, bacterial MsbA